VVDDSDEVVVLVLVVGGIEVVEVALLVEDVVDVVSTVV
jgi:hypothetical protein